MTSRWAESGGVDGAAYAARFERLAASGADVHGEASRIAGLVPPGARILDAGCGTGRVAIRLAELGYRCTGVDSDPSMLAEAERASTAVTWALADLADLGDSVSIDGPFDLVVAAGNVIPLLAAGTEALVVGALAGQLVEGGRLVTGFGLDRGHLPPSAALLALDDFDAWCAAAGLRLVERHATWDGQPYVDGGGYAVSVHVRAA